MKRGTPTGILAIALTVFLLTVGACGAPVPRESGQPKGSGKPMADAGGTLVNPGKLTICTYGGFAPVCSKQNGELVGYDVTFLEQFASLSLGGLPTVKIEKDFNGIWTWPGQGACDVAGAGVMERTDRDVGTDAQWSDPYFEVKRSMLVRTADQAAFDDYQTLSGKKIVVTRGSTADVDAQTRYPNCKPLLYVDEVVPVDQQADAQGYIVRELIAKGKVDAFGEGDVSNDYLRDRYTSEVPGGLAVADVHPIDGGPETFNFITRNDSGVDEQLKAFIAKYKHCYLKDASSYAPSP